MKYAPAVSDVVYRHLEVVVGALKKAHIFALCTLKNLLCSMSVIKWYQYVRTSVYNLLGGSGGS